jgi:selenocysteine lyase/cysteine desulfurase
VRHGRLRIAPSYYDDIDEIDRLLQALRRA